MDTSQNDTVTDPTVPTVKPKAVKKESVIQTLTRLSVEMGAMGRHCSSVRKSETHADAAGPHIEGQVAGNGSDRTS